ncbi:N-acetylmuramoyl-L-alanine amidase [Nocardioides sp. Arc9.136]|uniref:peptidoglycan recognition protein family protein n=1 Tax=Nocardioides sp. Arc9.136 TaxID=2996826 RepID=UPI002665B42A|nr:N-acetylmuramoyl-L-alanine amidase [Nocardioides sp. Arc9.136]WKN47162.1 N-acetylmuramoyl-L-alanine amidase [Nocardioides sp. Arc9.136]
MTYRYLTQLAGALRAADLKVVEVPGWKTRGRPASTGGFDPVGVLWHHTGSKDTNPKSIADDRAYAEWLAEIGRSDLPAPLCQLSIGRDGTVYVCAAGRGNHAGTARASGTVAGGDGNQLYVGVECQNTGSEGWSDAQRDAMVTTGAVLAELLHTSAQAQRAHRETSVTGKWDPGLLDMDAFRRDVAAELVTKERPEEPDPEPTRVEEIRQLLREALKHAKSAKRRRRLQAALDRLPSR